MGKTKYLDDIMKLFEKSSVVTFDSINRIIKNKKSVKGYARKMVHYLVKNGKISRLGKGIYTAKDNINLVIFCFQPAYFGLQDAMSFYNLWEQETIPIIITNRKVRKGIRSILGQNVLIRNIDKKYFFGYEDFQEGDVALPYSDIEKTFIDMIYFKEHLDEEVIDNFKEKINKKRLKDYLKRYPLRFRKIVLTRLRG